MMRIFSYPGFRAQDSAPVRFARRRGALAGGLMALSVAAAGCTFPPPLADRSGEGADQQESPRYVIVQPGDSVSVIADRTGVPSRAIIAENDLREPFTVYPGQRLSLPQARFHRVDSGETLYRIAQNYQVDVDAVAHANQLDTPYTIFVGQSLRIPDGPGRQPDQQEVADRGPETGDSESREPRVLEADAATPWRDPGQRSTSQEEPDTREAQSGPRALTQPSSTSSDRSVTAEQLDAPSPATPQTISEPPAESRAEDDAPPPPEADDSPVPAEADMTAQPVIEVEPDDTASEEVETTPEESRQEEQPDPAPSQEEAQAVNEEQANLPAVSAPASRSSDRFAWPLDGPIISDFGPKDDGQHNDGINIDGAQGDPIRAADNGVVAYAGSELRGYGNLIILRHADGWVTAYGHADRITVQRGQSVSVGETIGEVGSTGAVSSPQLHFEIRRQSTPVDPMDYLAPRS